MSQIDVYGIGNALVDTAFEVDDGFFKEAGIQKGFMTLIEEEQQKNILKICLLYTSPSPRDRG